MTGCCGRTGLAGGRRKSTKYRGMGAAVPRHQPQGADDSDGQHTGGQVEETAPQRALTGKLGQRSEEEDRGGADSRVLPYLNNQPKSRTHDGDAEDNHK